VELILASGSPYRAQVLRAAGHSVRTDPPEVDERSLDPVFDENGPEALALELARLKVARVRHRHPGVPVLGGDQVGVLETPAGRRMLAKATGEEAAVEQLMAMSGTTHRLVNALVVGYESDDGVVTSVEGLDVQVVTMRPYEEATARRYVRIHEPFDTAGSYRIEDDFGLVESVEGEDDSGVLGMPLPLLERLLAHLREETEGAAGGGA
jgi:septum formation protein